MKKSINSIKKNGKIVITKNLKGIKGGFLGNGLTPNGNNKSFGGNGNLSSVHHCPLTKNMQI